MLFKDRISGVEHIVKNKKDIEIYKTAIQEGCLKYCDGFSCVVVSSDDDGKKPYAVIKKSTGVLSKIFILGPYPQIRLFDSIYQAQVGEIVSLDDIGLVKIVSEKLNLDMEEKIEEVKEEIVEEENFDVKEAFGIEDEVIVSDTFEVKEDLPPKTVEEISEEEITPTIEGAETPTVEPVKTNNKKAGRKKKK